MNRVDQIKRELSENQVKKNDYLVSKKITKVELYGKDPFCRVNVEQVNKLLVQDKNVAINQYRQEATDRLVKKINEKGKRKEINKSENMVDLLERQKKEAELKAEKEKETEKRKNGGLPPVALPKVNPSNMFDAKRFSKLQNFGAFSLGIDKFIAGGGKTKPDEITTERPLDSKDPIEPEIVSNSKGIKKEYRKGDYIPNLSTIEEKVKQKKAARDPSKPKP